MSYRWIKRNYKLTKEQKERGVIFSSELRNYTLHDVGKIHEVFADQEDRCEVISRLKDVKFFKNWAQEEGFNCELIERS